MATPYDVIVIGGGIAGCGTALYLARDGARVVLVERDRLGAGASEANAGSLHAQIPPDPFRQYGLGWAARFQSAVRLFNASLAMWRGLEADLGADLEIRFGGGLLVGSTDAELREIEQKVANERAAGLTVELLNAADLRRIAPYLSDRALGGAFCAEEGKANPLLVAPAFAAAARAAGVEIHARAGTAAIARERDGYAVRSGDLTLRAPRLVIAAGMESGTLAAQLGVQLAIQAFPIQVSVTEPAAPLLPHLVYCAGEKLTMKQAKVGSLLIGGGWPARLDARGRPIVDIASLAANLKLAVDVVPAVGSLNLLRTWAAWVNGTDDWMPILGALPGASGAFINYVPWMGFTGGPAAARGIADMVLGRPPSLDVPFADFAPALAA